MTDHQNSSADIVERLEGQIQDQGDAYWEELYRQRKDAAAEIRRLRDVAQRPVVWRVRYCGQWMYFEDKANAEIYAQEDDNTEPLYASQPSPAATVSNSAELACGNSSQASQHHNGDLQPSSAEAAHNGSSADSGPSPIRLEQALHEVSVYGIGATSDTNQRVIVEAAKALAALRAQPQTSLIPTEITKEMALAGRKALAAVADRMEEAKLLATSSVDFWQRIGHEPANEIYAAMVAVALTRPQSRSGDL